MKKIFFIILCCSCVISCSNKKELLNSKDFLIKYIKTVSEEQSKYSLEYTDKMKQFYWNNKDKENAQYPEFPRMFNSFNNNYYAIYKKEIKIISNIERESLKGNDLYDGISFTNKFYFTREQIGEIVNNQFIIFDKPLEINDVIEVVKYKENYYIFSYGSTHFEILEKDLPLLKERGIIE